MFQMYKPAAWFPTKIVDAAVSALFTALLFICITANRSTLDWEMTLQTYTKVHSSSGGGMTPANIHNLPDNDVPIITFHYAEGVCRKVYGAVLVKVQFLCHQTTAPPL